MSKERYQWYMGTSEIIDNKTKKFITQDCPELLNKQSKQIADLETKLAESEENCFDLQQRLADKEEQCRECKHLNKKIELNIKNKLLIENEELKQQLAEKEKENELMTKTLRMFKCIEKEINQDKISFALEQLEKILKTLEEQQFFRKEDTAYCVHPAQIAEHISNQINVLRNNKDGIH